MRVISVNVNGIRAAMRRGGMQWLAAAEADVLCLQEVRASDVALGKCLVEAGLGHWHVAHTEGAFKGRAGVAVVTKHPQTEVSVGIDDKFVDEGRWIEAMIDTPSGQLTVASVYVHTGEAGSVRQDEKFAFLDAVTSRMSRAVDQGTSMLVAGDLNIAHRELDLKNWKGNLGKAGFLPDEQLYLDRWFEDDAWVDVHRTLHGPGPGPYTWWSWRGMAFDNDAGWRIDYQLATGPLAARARSARVGRAATYSERWSDHAPVVIDYDF